MNVQSDPRDDERYYESNPLSFLNDFHFIESENNSRYRQQQFQNFIQARGEIEGLSTVPQSTTLRTGHQPCQACNSMDLNLLSAESYHDIPYGETRSGRQENENAQLYGGLVAKDASPSPPPKTRTRRSLRKDASKNTSTEDNNSRPRGRPRLDTRDQTAAEVGLSP